MCGLKPVSQLSPVTHTIRLTQCFIYISMCTLLSVKYCFRKPYCYYGRTMVQLCVILLWYSQS